MDKNTATEWAGYTMKQHPEHTDGILVLDPAGNSCMPGAIWFKDEESAKKGIAALKLAESTGGDFWMFFELSR